MTFPAGVTLCAVTIPASATWQGGISPIQATLTPGRAVTHRKSNTPLEAVTGTATGPSGEGLVLLVPHSEQVGYRDASGNSVTGWEYDVVATYHNTSNVLTTVTKQIFIPRGASEVNLLTATDRTTGKTGGAVELPARLSEAALSATYVPKWKPNTAYAAGDAVLSPGGDIVTAKATFTSGATYSAANWNVSPTYAQSDKLRGTVPKWAPNTVYAKSAPVMAPDGTIVNALAAFTSGATYNAANWSAPKGAITEAGTPVGSPPVVKPKGDGRGGVWEYTHNDDTGYLFHLLMGIDSLSGAWLMGLGVDNGLGNGIIIRNKSQGIGLKIEQVERIASATAYGLAVQQNSALAPAVHMELRGANADGLGIPATLMELYSYVNDDTTALQRWYSYGATAGSVLAGSGKFRWDKSMDIVGDTFNVRSYDSTPAPARRHIKTTALTGQTYWSPTGTDNLWYGFRFNSGGSNFNISTAPSGANPDTATYTDIIKIKHGQLGFFGTAAVSRPVLTYSKTGESAPEAALRGALAALGLVTDSTVA